jgi:transcription regulator MmyB-like protein
VPADAGDRDDSVLERLPQRLEHGAWELCELVEQENTAMPQRAGMYLDASAVTSHGLRSGCHVVKTWDCLRGGQRRDRVDWERVAGECVAILRWAVGRDPYDRDLSDLVGELAKHSEAFRTRWAAHDVRFHNTGVKRFHHPVVGELTLSYNRLDLAADHGLAIFTMPPSPVRALTRR